VNSECSREGGKEKDWLSEHPVSIVYVGFKTNTIPLRLGMSCSRVELGKGSDEPFMKCLLNSAPVIVPSLCGNRAVDPAVHLSQGISLLPVSQIPVSLHRWHFVWSYIEELFLSLEMKQIYDIL
jgi:hypothetical protein